ncbi:transposase-like protein [Beauveria bassiana ARSEF 2860]|uniref:Transposase-like protein n=1 Tax=Beauveria bassiana (strain ARSEF 2860) TaxID=655819 RepID=J5JE41_BEAB2|nr:transposase-like protein [Beauveria bassiana ARSEF 2860]EJP62011.1 transposase-like protein [Beauveria bassiana ARSEF 2860]
MHQQSFWEQLATACGGAGVLLLLPAEFQKEHARRLKIEDRATLFTSIAARHPNLKYDITVLTDLLSYYYYNKVLPEWQIPLENLPEADIATRRQRGLRELVLFDVTSHFASDGGDSATPPNTPSLNPLIDPSMLDYEYTEDQPMDFTPFSSGHGQEFIPPNPEAVQEGLGIASDVDESMHELSCTGIPGIILDEQATIPLCILLSSSVSDLSLQYAATSLSSRSRHRTQKHRNQRIICDDVRVCLRVAVRYLRRKVASEDVPVPMAARLPFIIGLVQSALSRINLSIDGWRAHNRREYVAVCGHFVDDKGHPRTLLLGFPRRHGGHTGNDLAELVKPVILQYGIGEKLGSFVMDNAGDNAKCLEALQRSLPSNYMIERALKCRPAIDLYQAQWRSPDKNDRHENDFLAEADWQELELFYTLLQPFERLTKRLQGRAESEGNEGGQGSVWQVLYAMDFLLTKLESVKEEIDIMDADSEGALPPYYSAGVLAAWSKINAYYELTDQSPIYRMAIALHPAYQFEYFREKWWKREEWIKTAKKELNVYYDRFAAATVATEHVDQAETSPSSSPTSDDEFDAWGHTTDRPHRGKRRKVETEWEIWVKQVPSKDEMSVKNPLAWWVDRGHVWPVLSKLALNIFSTPAMSAEPERVFSDGGELITDKRNGLGDDTVEAEMMQKNWIASNILQRIATPQGLYELPD